METFEAGQYYVGDPCYVVESAKWSKFCDECDNGAQTLDGFKMWSANTAHGDGCYNDKDGNEYGVDAGLLGIVPFAYCEKQGAECVAEAHRLGKVHTFAAPFTVSCDDGKFKFGHVKINTR